MLKRFFISMLGTVAGLWLSIAIGMLVLFSVVGGIMSMSEGKNKITDKSILYLNLEGEISERQQEQGLADMLRDYKKPIQTLEQMVAAIRSAASDSKIEGIYIEAAGSAAGYATRQELVEALKAFKESGKWVYAYGDAYAQGDYLLASTADKVFLNPVGSVDVRGIGTQTPFFTGLLDKLGIKVQVVKVGTYKSAVEPFILTSMSEPARQQNQVFVDSIWNYYSTTVAANRGVGPADVSAWANGLCFTWTADQDTEAGIATEKMYRREFEQMLRDLTDTDADTDLPLVTPAKYVEANGLNNFYFQSKHVAILYAVGDIVDSGEGGIVGADMVPQIIDLADDDEVAGLILRVNSGGGSAFASEQIWEALEYFKSTGKPFYVSMGDYAASGGYYISCGADKIFADATTLTGSIGVFGMIPDFSGFVNGKLGINFSTVASGPNATFLSLMEPLSAQQKASMQNYVENTYELFVSRVAQGRHLEHADVKAIAEGRVWVGSSAIEIGLVDELGSLHAAVCELTQQLELDQNAWLSYPDVKTDFFERLAEEASKMEANAPAQLLGTDGAKALKFVKTLKEMNPVQARMPEIELR